MKKTFVFLSRIDLQYEEFQNLDGKCKALEQDMEEFAKSTARSYQILSQFFAREVSIIAESIKKIESTVKNIRDNQRNIGIGLIVLVLVGIGFIIFRMRRNVVRL